METETIHVKKSEVAISLGAIFDFLLKHWKSIIIISFVGAILGLGIGFIPKTEKIEMKNVNEEKIAIFHDYSKLLSDKLAEKQNDIILNLNSDEVFVGQLDNYISADKNDIHIVYDAFKRVLLDSNLWNDISSLFDDAYSTEQLKNIVSVSSKLENIAGSSKTEDGSASGNDNNFQNDCISFKVIGSSKEICNKMIDILSLYVSKFENGIKSEFNSYSKKTEMRNIYKSDEIYQNRMHQILVEIEELTNKVNSLKSNLNSDEKTLSKQLYPEDWKIKETDNEKSILSYLKMPVLLAFVAFFIICFIYTMKFIFNNKIKTADELDKMFGLHVFGVYKASEDKKGFDGVLQKREAKKDLPENTKDYIVNSVKGLNKMPAVLLGNKNNSTVKQFMDDLTKLCSDFTSYGQLQSDSEAMEVAHKQNNVILIINLWNTTMDEVNREVEIAIAQNINVLGCIVVK